MPKRLFETRKIYLEQPDGDTDLLVLGLQRLGSPETTKCQICMIIGQGELTLRDVDKLIGQLLIWRAAHT